MLSVFVVQRSGYAIDCFNEIDPIYYQTNPAGEIHIQTPADISAVRNRIVNFVWKGNGIPGRLPDQVTKDVSAAAYLNTSNFSNLARIDSILIVMDHNFTSRAYLLHPVTSNNRLVIFHQGHSPTLNEDGGNETIKYLLGQGFTVLAFQMPLFGPNSGPTSEHNNLAGYESATLSPFKFFLEPIAVSLNYIRSEYNVSDVSMTGISGGGWTTHLYAAIDIRISKSFPVAGSLPLYLREPPCGTRDRGDYEQGKTTSAEVANFYQNIASYLDLYILASYGQGRAQVQILNKFDECCFAGIRYQTYENTVKARMAALGAGSFTVALDTSHWSHKISNWALNSVLGLELIPAPSAIPTAPSALSVVPTAATPSATGIQ